MPSILAAVALVALVPMVSFALHRYLLPGLPPAPFASPDGPSPFIWVADRFGVRHLQPLERRYQWLNRVLLLVSVPGVVTLAVAWTLVLGWLADLRLRGLPADTLLLRPEPAWALWLGPGLFLGVTSSLIPLAPLTRLLLRYRLSDYIRHERARTGLDEWAGQKSALVFLVPIVGLTALAMDWYVRFDADTIAVNSFVGLGETVYPYSSVRRIVQTSHLRAPFNNEVERKRLFIFFADGRRWCNEDLVRSSRFRDDEETVIRIVCRRAGRPLTRARLLEDVLHLPDQDTNQD
jgi:hypothetical protein